VLPVLPEKNSIYPVSRLCEEKGLTWGVAGRSASRLKAALKEMAEKFDADLSEVPIIIADVRDDESLKRMTARARIILNYIGPYRFFGEQVIKACLETQTHHVDVSGEPQYMEKMQLKYHELALEKGVYIVSACGYDSIPMDMGVIFLQKEFQGTLNSVESYLEIIEQYKIPGATLNYGTWESGIHAAVNAKELKEIEDELFPRPLPKFIPVLKKRGNPHKEEVNAKYVIPFVGPDKSVAQRTQRYFYDYENKRPIQVETYLCLKSIFSVILFVIFGILFKILTKFPRGVQLLKDHPVFFSCGLFSREGPSEIKMENMDFRLTLIGEGWPEIIPNKNDRFANLPSKKIIGRVTGTNPAYGACTIALTCAAITILKESHLMPNNGGVYPPGAAFHKTGLIKMLNANGITFELVDIKNLQHFKIEMFK